MSLQEVLSTLRNNVPNYYQVNFYTSSELKNTIRVVTTTNKKHTEQILSKIHNLLKSLPINYETLKLPFRDEFHLFIINDKEDTIRFYETTLYYQMKQLKAIKDQELPLMEEMLNIVKLIKQLKE